MPHLPLAGTRLAAVVVLAALAAAPALAQTAAPDSAGCLAGSCQDGASTFRFADGADLTPRASVRASVRAPGACATVRLTLTR